MKRLLTLLVLVGCTGAVMAEGATCAATASEKKLAGAAKSSFMKKCQREACEAQAIDKNGKPLAGAAKNSFVKKCQATQ